VNAFHVLGVLFVLWAVGLAVVGVTHEGFPATGGQALAVGAVSVLMAAATIAAGIVTAALEEDEHEARGRPAPMAAPDAAVLRLRADPGGALRFEPDTLDAPRGSVELVMRNPSPIPHNVSLEGDGEGRTVGTGGSSTVSATLQPGVYRYYCSVPGHQEAGMEGSLTISR